MPETDADGEPLHDPHIWNSPDAWSLVVGHVADNGPGKRAGIKPFDMVVRADDQPVVHAGSIRKVLAYRRPGERAKLTILRGGELIELEFPVEEIPRLASAS